MWRPGAKINNKAIWISYRGGEPFEVSFWQIDNKGKVQKPMTLEEMKEIPTEPFPKQKIEVDFTIDDTFDFFTPEEEQHNLDIFLKEQEEEEAAYNQQLQEEFDFEERLETFVLSEQYEEDQLKERYDKKRDEMVQWYRETFPYKDAEKEAGSYAHRRVIGPNDIHLMRIGDGYVEIF